MPFYYFGLKNVLVIYAILKIQSSNEVYRHISKLKFIMTASIFTINKYTRKPTTISAMLLFSEAPIQQSLKKDKSSVNKSTESLPSFRNPSNISAKSESLPFLKS